MKIFLIQFILARLIPLNCSAQDTAGKAVHIYSRTWSDSFLYDSRLPDTLASGKWIIYFADKKSIALEAFYEHKQKSGTWIYYYPDGRKRKGCSYSKGNPDPDKPIIEWYENGNISHQRVKLDVCIQDIEFYESGSVKSVKYYATNEMTDKYAVPDPTTDRALGPPPVDECGHWFLYGEYGCIEEEELWKYGFNGLNHIYSSAEIGSDLGSITLSGPFRNTNGDCSKFYEVTDLGKQDTFFYKSYFPNGQINYQGIYIYNYEIEKYGLEPDQKWEKFDKNGKLLKESFYDKGKLLKEIDYANPHR